MKRPLTRAAMTILTVVVLFACASTIRTGKISIVTITIGGSQGTAVLKAEAATPWTKLKHYLADAKWMSEAYAYIPSIVQVLTVTVTAPDIATPIVGVSSVSLTQTTATLKIEVPNGTDRHFLVEGLRALPGGVTQTVFSGTNRTDLNGTDVNLQINMNFVGAGIYVNPGRLLTANTPTCGGSVAAACATITHVLTSRPATTNNDIIVALAGNYNIGAGAPYETFPLQLRPGMALLCTGTGFSSVIDAATFGTTAIRGNDNASVDNCMIKVGQGGTGVTDLANPQLLITAATRINGSALEVPTGATGPSVGIVLANDKSILLDSSVTGTNASFQAIGAQVNGGKPSISGNTITGLPIGIDLSTNAGDALVTANTISGNTNGISISAIGKPTVERNTIANNTTGISVNLGSPLISANAIQFNFKGIEIFDGNATITNNNIDHNNAYGVSISGSSTANAKINSNNIFCNSTWDVYILSALSTIDLQDNAWDHDAGTNPPGPLVSNTGGGLSSYDIVFSSPTPTPLYDRIRPAVPGGCVPIPIQ